MGRNKKEHRKEICGIYKITNKSNNGLNVVHYKRGVIT